MEGLGDAAEAVPGAGRVAAVARAEDDESERRREGPELIGATADYARTFQEDLGTYHYTGDMKRMQDERVTDFATERRKRLTGAG